MFDHQAEWSQCSSEGRARFELGGTLEFHCVVSTALFRLRSRLASTTVGSRAVRRKLAGHAVQESNACIHQHLGEERHGTIAYKIRARKNDCGVLGLLLGVVPAGGVHAVSLQCTATWAV